MIDHMEDIIASNERFNKLNDFDVVLECVMGKSVTILSITPLYQ
ncbi:hypothetical protein [Ursidibacter sp. B-7004-1]